MTTTPTQPTPQPAGDAALSAMTKALQAAWEKSEPDQNHPASYLVDAMARAALETARAIQAGKGEYRLLTARDVIEEGDEILDDSTTEWLPLVGWERGMQYNPGSLMPMRRVVLEVNASEHKGEQ